MKPVSVIVQHSPNVFFMGEGQMYAYDDFNKIHQSACLSHEHAGDYSMTECDVLFDNEQAIGFQFPISPLAKATSLAAYAAETLACLEKTLADDPEDTELAKAIELLKTITW